MDLGAMITRHARFRPHNHGVIFEHHRLTWSEFNTRVNRLANALTKLGVRKGEKIACLLPNSIELIDVYWAVAKTGIVIVPLSPLLRGKGLTTLLNDSDAVTVITTYSMVEFLEPLRDNLPEIRHWILIDSPDTLGYLDYQALVANERADEPPDNQIDQSDLYNIMYSSGTTGLPKGIMHTHRIRAYYCLGFTAAFRITPESVLLHAGSLVFNGAFLTFAPAFYQGCTYILHPNFDVRRLVETIEREKVTHIVMVPSQIIALLSSPDFDPNRMRSLEMLLTVGAPLHLEYKQKLNRHLPGIFYELYGLTEGFATILDKTMCENKLASVGVPMPLSQIKVVDANGNELPPGQVGEIIGRDPMQMAGYYKRPDLTAEVIRDGWLYSGDLGYIDGDGFLYLVDRKKDMIITGGVNVYPHDIEEVVMQHPNVIEAAVFGIPHDKWIETPVAAVILKDKTATSPEVLCEWVNERVEARYQRISRVIVYEEFPRNVAGKTLKRTMREVFWQSQGTSI